MYARRMQTTKSGNTKRQLAEIVSHNHLRGWGLGLVSGFEGLGFRVWGLGIRVSGLGFRVSGLGFRVQGLGFRVQGSRVEGLWGIRPQRQTCPVNPCNP